MEMNWTKQRVIIMKVKEIVSKLDLEVLEAENLEQEVKNGYTGDMLSNVMAKLKEGELWITVQGHQNVAAVALLTGAAGVIVAENFDVDQKTREHARKEGLNLFSSSLSAFELSGLLYKLGVNGE